MKLAIVGGRNFDDYDLMSKFILSNFELSEIDAIVSGGAKGADTLAERFANEHNLLFIVKNADWAKYGRAAGPIRNKLIIEEADAVVALLTRTSKGTKNSISIANKLGKTVKIQHV